MTLLEMKAALQKSAADILESLPANSTFRDAKGYAADIGDKVVDLLRAEFPDIAALTAEQIESVIKPLLLEGYGCAADIAGAIMKLLNDAAKISFNPVLPEGDVARIENLVEKMISEGAEETAWMLDNDVIDNICNSAVLDTIRLNAEFQKTAGLTTMVTRSMVGYCCGWCESLIGTYRLDDIPRNFWAMHKDCNCYIDYKPQKRQWSRITYYYDADDKRRKRTEML